jgi:hypothetical protein
MVCWNRSTFPQVVGWLGREFFCTTPNAASLASKLLRPPRTFWEACRTVYTIALSVNVEAGQPCSVTAAWNVSSTTGPVTRR